MPDAHAAPDADDAINQVLRAERQAQQAVAQCEQQAAQLVADARLRAKRAQEGAEQRLHILRERMRANTAQQIAALDSAAKALPQRAQPDATAHAKLEQAVVALAAILSGEAHDERL